MIEQVWIKVLEQVPLVGAFILFTLYITKTYLEALEKQRQGFEKQTTAIVEAMNHMNESICNKLDQQARRSRRKPAKQAE